MSSSCRRPNRIDGGRYEFPRHVPPAADHRGREGQCPARPGRLVDLDRGRARGRPRGAALRAAAPARLPVRPRRRDRLPAVRRRPGGRPPGHERGRVTGAVRRGHPPLPDGRAPPGQVRAEAPGVPALPDDGARPPGATGAGRPVRRTTSARRDGSGRPSSIIRSPDLGFEVGPGRGPAARSPDSARGVVLGFDDGWPWLQVFSGDTHGELARTSLAVEPMSCPPDAFRSGADLVVLEPEESQPGVVL